MDRILKDQITAMGRFFGKTVELYAAWAKTKGLSYNKLAVIATLFYHPYGTQSQVCSDWAIPKQTVSTICKGLEREGLIYYMHINNDNREKCMALTREGQVIFRPIMKELQAIEAHTLTSLGEQQTAELLKEMNNFVQAFKEGLEQVELNQEIGNRK
ncbi:MarR family winged helix-turn-helix transcriptional regulator [Veillonella intestinalis]|uniref:MarR family winged helix-turn-helix transcriptional regulator n=1 Tax=Veillonella intestinalis TaxID=2941341 RepID=UPI00203AFE9A|nr:MarR family winged helix-turn-helix transcriptional regulator [Veillonella intestinalis]